MILSDHPELEIKLVDVIESFTPKIAGGWISNGWEKSITINDCKTRFRSYLLKLKNEGSVDVTNYL